MFGNSAADTKSVDPMSKPGRPGGLRVKVAASLAAIPAMAGLTLFAPSSASAAPNTLYTGCVFYLTASNGDSTPGPVQINITSWSHISDKARPNNVRITNHTGRAIDIITDRWWDNFVNIGDRGPGASGMVDNGQISWNPPDDLVKYESTLGVGAQATSRVGLNGSIQIHDGDCT